MRKLLYSVLQKKLEHPRYLTLAQREQIVKEGLDDRGDGVRVAAAKVVEAWFDAIVLDIGTGAIQKALREFLHLFDVIAGEKAAIDALLSLFTTRKDIWDGIDFDGVFLPSDFSFSCASQDKIS